jgi:3,2-trans-enoyl-CoA isomerase
MLACRALVRRFPGRDLCTVARAPLVEVWRAPAGSGTDAAAIVSLARPPVNALNVDLVTSLTQTVRALEADGTTKGFVLCSGPEGLGKVFSAGLDFASFAGASREELTLFWTAVQDMWMALFGTHLATVAAVTGHAPAGGCLLAMCCDARIMALGGAKVARIGANESRIGLAVPPFFVDTMEHAIGTRQTEKMLTYGSLIDAVEAKRIGLVDETVERDEVMPRSIAALDELLAIPDGARRATKLAMRTKVVERLRSNRAGDMQFFIDSVTSEAALEVLAHHRARLGGAK